jgi:hypothetical protein
MYIVVSKGSAGLGATSLNHGYFWMRWRTVWTNTFAKREKVIYVHKLFAMAAALSVPKGCLCRKGAVATTAVAVLVVLLQRQPHSAVEGCE